MRLHIVESKNAKSLYVIKSVYFNKKRTSKVVEKLGTYDELKKKLDEDPIVWAKKYVEQLNKEIKKEQKDVLIAYNPSKLISKEQPCSFNVGYLFLQKIYYELGLDIICKSISKKYKFEYDLNDILSRLIYSRIIYPSSKLATFELSKKFLETPRFELQHIYRSLEVLSKETDFIQSELYKNSLNISSRNTDVLYYDCTNYFFEVEEESGLRQYGKSKEHRPNPIVQMGLFMDGNGIPLAFNISSGNTNEQITLTPLEEKILHDFNLSKFVVCTDAGLSSYVNRKFNDKKGRFFITTQSIKKLKKHLKEWALNPNGWRLDNTNKEYTLEEINSNYDDFKDKIFFKERWINENNLEQKLIVTYSLKYKYYQQEIRNSQIERAKDKLNSKSFKLDRYNQNDFKRFIRKTNITSDGEIAEKKVFSLNTEIIKNEEQFDGFYGVCTNLEKDVHEIIRISKRRWEIEESFRILKSEFKARPVYLSRDDRITAHFTTCFLSLVILRFLEKRLDEKYTSHHIITTLKEMNVLEKLEQGHIPLYIRTDLTDDLHDKFRFRTDYQIITDAKIKKILKNTKY